MIHLVTSHVRRCLILLLALLISVALLPRPARAAGIAVSEGSLAEAFAANPGGDSFVVTGSVAACDIPAGITVEIAAGGKLTGASFHNEGRVIGAYSGLIYNEGDASKVTGATLRQPGPATAQTVSAVYYDGNSMTEAAVYHKNKLWILSGHTVSSLVINHVFYWADNSAVGQAITYAISYRLGDGTETPLTLDPAVYPASYQVKDVDQTIPAGPALDGKAFGGWLCAGLTGGQTLTIPAGTNQDLILYYQVADETEGPGSAGGQISGGGFSGMGGFGGGGGFSGGASGGVGIDSITALLGDDGEESSVQSAAPVSNIMSNAGGMRIRSAKNATRRVITNDGGQSSAPMSAPVKKTDFPWQWLGLGLGLALLLTLGILALKKRAAAKTAAMYEKLNIR